jgi:hypothetical protein
MEFEFSSKTTIVLAPLSSTSTWEESIFGVGSKADVSRSTVAQIGAT